MKDIISKINESEWGERQSSKYEKTVEKMADKFLSYINDHFDEGDPEYEQLIFHFLNQLSYDTGKLTNVGIIIGQWAEENIDNDD